MNFWVCARVGMGRSTSQGRSRSRFASIIRQVRLHQLARFLSTPCASLSTRQKLLSPLPSLATALDTDSSVLVERRGTRCHLHRHACPALHSLAPLPQQASLHGALNFQQIALIRWLGASLGTSMASRPLVCAHHHPHSSASPRVVARRYQVDICRA